ISCCFYWGYIDTARVRRPNGIRLRLKRHLLGVCYAIAKLRLLTPANLLIAIKRLNNEFRTSHVFDGFAVQFALLGGSFIAGALVYKAVFIPAGKDDPANVDRQHD